MNQIGVAVVGTGFMGWVHVEALRRVGVPVVGILASDHEKSRLAAAGLGVSKAYRDFDEVLQDPDVRSVHIGVPNRLHFEMARQALIAGKHVLCEKPLAMTSEESAALVRLAAEHPRLAAAVNYNIRYYPLCVEARQKIRTGELGELIHICGNYAQDWLLLPTDYNWRVLAEEGGELRAVADIGTHWLDLIRFITGRDIEAVCADLVTVHPVRQRPLMEVQTFKSGEITPASSESVEITTEDYGGILLRFSGGPMGCFWVSQVMAGRKNCLRFEIAGSKQAYSWNSENPNELWIGRRGQANEVLVRDPALLSDAAREAADYPAGHNEGYADTFKHCFRDFYHYIAADDFSVPPPFPTFADGHREIVLCESILQSHRERRWITV